MGITIYRSVGNILQFKQVIGSNIKGAYASNNLILNQKTRESPLNLKVKSRLFFKQVATGRKSLIHLNIHHSLKIFSNAYRVRIGIASNVLHISHGGMKVKFNPVANSLHILQNALADACKPAGNVLVITDAAIAIMIRNLMVNQFLSIQSNAVCYTYNDKFFAIPIVLPTPPGGDNGRCS